MTTLKGINGESAVGIWITQGINEQAIIYAEEFGKELVAPTIPKGDGKSFPNKSEAMTTSQIRNFFGEVQRMRMKGYNEVQFVLLKPKLAYSAKRNGTQGSEDFKTIFDSAINAVIHSNDKTKSFENFTAFLEAVLAYHKANGGK